MKLEKKKKKCEDSLSYCNIYKKKSIERIRNQIILLKEIGCYPEINIASSNSICIKHLFFLQSTVQQYILV